MPRLITYDDLSICDMCEDFWCKFHNKHFYDCTCQFKWEWEECHLKS